MGEVETGRGRLGLGWEWVMGHGPWEGVGDAVGVGGCTGGISFWGVEVKKRGLLFKFAFFFRCTYIVGASVATVVLHCVGLRHARLCGGSLSSDFTLCEKLSLGKNLHLKRDGGPHL